jgi:hypothetical protein
MGVSWTAGPRRDAAAKRSDWVRSEQELHVKERPASILSSVERVKTLSRFAHVLLQHGPEALSHDRHVDARGIG